MIGTRLRWLIGGSLVLGLAGCEVHAGSCEKNDAGDCKSLFDDEDGGLDGGKSDGGGSNGGSRDGAVGDGGSVGADAASSSDAGGGFGQGPGPALDLNGLCMALGSVGIAWSEHFVDCCTPDERNATKMEDNIVGLFGYAPYESAQKPGSVEGCVSVNKALLDGGRAIYDATYASVCVAEFSKGFGTLATPPTTCEAGGYVFEDYQSKVGHGAPALAQIEVCRRTIAGKVALGDECAKDFECQLGLACRPGFGGGAGTTNTCQEPAKANQSCTKDGDCLYGLTCVGSTPSGGKVCLPKDMLASQGGCERSVECIEGKICDVDGTNKCVAPPTGTPICK